MLDPDKPPRVNLTRSKVRAFITTVFLVLLIGALLTPSPVSLFFWGGFAAWSIAVLLWEFWF
jgi:hypothetical protein